MKKVILFLMLLFAGSMYPQTGSIKGVITNGSTGKPLPGTNLMLEGTKIGAASNLKGEYVIFKIPPGEYNLIARYMGFTQVTISNVNVNDGLTTEMNIALTPINSSIDIPKDLEAFYLKNLPDESQKILNEFKKINKAKYSLILQEVHFKNMAHDVDMKRENQMLLLKLKEETLVHKYKSSSGSEQRKIINELKEVISELLDLQETQRIKQIYDLELKLNELKMSIAEIRYNKQAAVENRIKELLEK
ncbi:MAG: carboxypeptidase-like regulatory domain-containing protein [Candidatus Cloacimonetes bacterium]|nr:carboxypeptidase-like regulatory domain-containing protein [Candidatus Cloacimonadota bacterium]MCF8393997.1 carboxypeptidase-like regulatory domain-containing protein [Melioribacteraceae bacterium]